MNELEQNYLAHHGILGQRWHKRNGPPYPLDAGDHSKSEKEAGYKKSLDGGRNEELYDRKAKKAATKAEKKEAKEHSKAVKKKAKEYQKEMNQLQEKEASYVNRAYDIQKNYERINRKTYDENTRRGKKWIEQSKILEAKYSDIVKENNKNRKEIDSLIDKMLNDSEVVYKTEQTDYSAYKDRKYVKELNKKYGGKNRLNYYNDGGVHTMSGTKYKVRSAETHGKRKSYNDPRKKKEYGHTHTSHYYYVY